MKILIILALGLLLAAVLPAQLTIETETPVVVSGPTPVPQPTTTPTLQSFFYSLAKTQVRIDVGAGPENYTTEEFSRAAAAVNVSIPTVATQLSLIRDEMIRARLAANPPTP